MPAEFTTKKVQISAALHARLIERQRVMQRRAGRQVTFTEVIEDALQKVEMIEAAGQVTP